MEKTQTIESPIRPQMKSLPGDLPQRPCALSTNLSIKDTLLRTNSNGEPELSLYQDRPATIDEMAQAIRTLRIAFPRSGDEFFSLLYERMKKNQFTAKRLEDAVEHVIDNFPYKELNVADIVSFDKRVKLYDKNQIWDECSRGYTTDDFQKVRIGEKLYWVKKVDIENSKR